MCIAKTPNITPPPNQTTAPDTLHNTYLDSTMVNGSLGRQSLVIRRQAQTSTTGAQGAGMGTGIQIGGGTAAPTIPLPPPIPGG